MIYSNDLCVNKYVIIKDLFQVKEFLTIMSSNTNKYNMSLLAKFTANLPPSSLHSFRRILKNVTENKQLPEIVIVDHQETFTNKFYHSVLDEFEKIGFNYHNISIGTDGTCKFSFSDFFFPKSFPFYCYQQKTALHFSIFHIH